jgi:putative nucleotidyltransferase with HDIG domain
MGQVSPAPGRVGNSEQAGDSHVDGVLGTVTRQLCQIPAVARASAFVRDEADPRALVLVAATGSDERLLGTRRGADEGIAGRVLATGKPIADEEGLWLPLAWGGHTRGVLFAAVDGPAEGLAEHEVALANGIAALAGTAAEHAEMRQRLEGTLHAGIEALASLIDLRDGYTGRHSDQVVEMARKVGARLGLGKRELAEIAIAARLHDIGKIGVPDSILLKPGPLTPIEQGLVRRHAAWGAETIERIPGLEAVAMAVRHHHERWDGNGYPAGLSGEDIPLASRVIGVCDAFGAMTSTRPYRRALEVHEAVRLLLAGAGAQFDARVVRAMCDALEEGELEVAAPEPKAQASSPEPAEPAAAPSRRPPTTRPPLARAFERLEALPALSESRQRLLALLGDDRSSADDIVVTIESDAALAIAVLRAANRLPGPRRGRIAGVPEAVRALSPEGIERLASRVATFEFFQRLPGWETPEQFRLHAVAAQQAAARIARHLDAEDRDAVIVAALLHDVGKLVLADASRDYPAAVLRGAKTPEDRVRAEQRELGVDHATVGAVLIRRWGLPNRIAMAVEGHHAATEPGDAAMVRLADLLTHYAQGHVVAPRELERAGRVIGLDPDDVRGLMFELPLPQVAQPRAHEPSPLSRQETRALRELAKGKVYKEIAAELGLAASTVRSHIHRTYEKLGAGDRAQAVLIATEKGWL